jgi:DNA-binding transcriptional MerR regulator
VADSAVTFTAKQVCAALGIPRGTLNAWAHAGYFFGFDAEFTRPGKSRRYSPDDLSRLAIIKYLVDFGVSMHQARIWADISVHYMNSETPTKIRAVLSSGSLQLILLDDQPFESALGDAADRASERNETLLELVIYPRAIVVEVKRRLSVLSKPASAVRTCAPDCAPNQ